MQKIHRNQILVGRSFVIFISLKLPIELLYAFSDCERVRNRKKQCSGFLARRENFIDAPVIGSWRLTLDPNP